MATNLLVRECTEHNVEMIHISAYLENTQHAEVSVLNWKLSNCDLKCKFLSAVWTVKFEGKSGFFFFFFFSKIYDGSLFSQSHNEQSPLFPLLHLT